MNGRRWTEDEDIYLEYFVLNGDTPITEAANFLDRSWGATCTRLTELRKIDPNVHYVKKRWSSKEDEFLKQNHQMLTDDQLAQSLNRTVEAVKTRRVKHLRLIKNQKITAKKKEIKELIEKGYYRPEISKKIDVDEKSLSTFLRLNNIHCPEVPYSQRTAKMKEVENRYINR
jgi:dsDNA-specific endonuclease/ATPase MutS2